MLKVVSVFMQLDVARLKASFDLSKLYVYLITEHIKMCTSYNKNKQRIGHGFMNTKLEHTSKVSLNLTRWCLWFVCFFPDLCFGPTNTFTTLDIIQWEVKLIVPSFS